MPTQIIISNALKKYKDIKLAIRGFGNLEPELHEIVGENEGERF